MNLQDIIKKIILLPIEFRRIGNNKSIYSLLKDTQYFSIYDKITEHSIQQELINHTEYIDHWLIWSEDKRSSEGWYFLKKENNKYVVGHIGPDGKNEKYIEFDDATNACATYIKSEIESIRLS